MIRLRVRRQIGAVVFRHLAAALLLIAPPVSSAAQRTLEIPVEEFKAVEEDREYAPIPTPTPGHPVDMMFGVMEHDLTGTLPEAVMEQILGASPFAFSEVVWGLKVSGAWTQSHTGSGTLQVFDFTEGMSASGAIDPERFQGEWGLRTYSARMQTNRDHSFTLSVALPPSSGTGVGSELGEAKRLFDATWLCHMFEPDNTGCQDGSDSHDYTKRPATVQNVDIRQDGGAYSIGFTARVEEYHYDSEIRGGPRSTPTGRVGIVRGWVCETAVWEENPDSCLVEDPLQVVETTPAHDRENVNFETPSIEWEFSDPVDIDSVKNGFRLTTRDPLNNEIEIPGEIVLEDSGRFAFSPDGDLESGVIYEGRLDGGPDGVQARDSDAYLEADHWWRFSTVLDLKFQNNSDEDPLRAHVFQTVRDAPLVTEKPTAIRIYPHWEEHDHIHPDWQPTSFPVNLELNVVSRTGRRVEPQFGGAATGDEIRLHRPDQFDDEHRRQAQHTINVYGWLPSKGDPPVMEARVFAHDPFPGPLDPAGAIAERPVDIWPVDPDPIVLHIAFATIGPWANGVPSAERSLANRAVRDAEVLAQQIFPVREVRSSFTSIETSRPGTGADPMVRLLADLRGSLYTAARPHDIFVVIYPLGVTSMGGGSVHHRGSDNPARGIIFNIADTVDGVTVPISMMAQALVHEIAHHHGLRHRPADAPEVAGIGLTIGGYADPTMEGFRIATDGMSGWNKSYEEGNGEYSGTPTPLMWPSPLLSERVWINEAEYRSLMDYLSH